MCIYYKMVTIVRSTLLAIFKYCCSVTKSSPLFVTPWAAVQQAFLSFAISQSLLKLMDHWVSDAIQPSHPLLPPSLFAIFFPCIRVFSSESILSIRWPKFWSFSISPPTEYSGLISFRMDWVWSPCSPRDSQESSPTPQFKGINFLALSLYSPTLTSIGLPS